MEGKTGRRLLGKEEYEGKREQPRKENRNKNSLMQRDKNEKERYSM